MFFTSLPRRADSLSLSLSLSLLFSLCNMIPKDTMKVSHYWGVYWGFGNMTFDIWAILKNTSKKVNEGAKWTKLHRHPVLEIKISKIVSLSIEVCNTYFYIEFAQKSLNIRHFQFSKVLGIIQNKLREYLSIITSIFKNFTVQGDHSSTSSLVSSLPSIHHLYKNQFLMLNP
jgi:hypothetical protein